MANFDREEALSFTILIALALVFIFGITVIVYLNVLNTFVIGANGDNGPGSINYDIAQGNLNQGSQNGINFGLTLAACVGVIFLIGLFIYVQVRAANIHREGGGGF